MLTRKINAALSLITTFLVLYHAIFMAVWMLSGCTITVFAPFLAWVLMGAMLMHVMVSIDLMVSAHMDVDTSKGKMYPKLNRGTMVQRITGILLAVFTALHVAGAAGFMQPPQFIHATVPPLFFTLVMVHTSISTSKALITLGIGSAKFIKIADIAVKLVCFITLIADIVGFYLYVC